MNRELLAKAFGDMNPNIVAESYRPVTEAASSSPERIVHMRKKRIITFALAAALILALGITAYAVWGNPRSVGTYIMPKTAEYTSLSELPKVEKDVGYPVTVPEQFSNGYVFNSLRVEGQALFGENNEVLKDYYAVHASYSKAGASALTLDISPVLGYEGRSEAPAPNEQRTINGIQVKLSLDHYKTVPPDYEKTEDDLAREASGHYYVSFGSEEIKEFDISFAEFTLDKVNYVLMDMAAGENSFDTLAQMAQEIIEAAQK